jgi:hypothetical protein
LEKGTYFIWVPEFVAVLSAFSSGFRKLLVAAGAILTIPTHIVLAIHPRVPPRGAQTSARCLRKGGGGPRRARRFGHEKKEEKAQ